MKLTELFNRKSTHDDARLNFAKWYNEVETFGERELNHVLETFDSHNQNIFNYFEGRLTKVSTESFNTKIKTFRTQFRGIWAQFGTVEK